MNFSISGMQASRCTLQTLVAQVKRLRFREDNVSKLLISQYHAEVDRIIQFGGSRKETAVRNAFFKLLNQYCEPKHFLLIPELDYQTKFGTVVYPDGTVKDALRLDWGYWESKGQEQNLDAKIREKLGQGYPNDNILFENAQMAVLIQRGEEVLRRVPEVPSLR